MKKSILILISIALLSCNVNKELRKKEKCNRKLEKLVEKCPTLLSNDTIRDTITVIVPEILIKDSVYVQIDTVELLKYITKDQIKYVIKSISLDTLINDSLYKLKITLSNGVLSYTIQIHERIIEKPTETITQSVTIDELSIWEELRLFLGRWFKWLIVFTVILILLWILNKIFNPFKK